MSVLPLPVPLAVKRFETPDSYATRLAHANGFGSLRMFRRALAFQPTDRFAAGYGIDKLTTYGSIDADSFARYCGHHRLGTGTRHASNDLWFGTITSAKRYCPKCVRSDLADATDRIEVSVYSRVAWTLGFVGRCTEHGCDLVEYQSDTTADFGAYVRFNMDKVAREADEAIDRQPNLFDVYVVNRLETGSGDSMLDRMVLRTCINACEAVGRISWPYRDSAHTRNSPEARSEDRQAGYQALLGHKSSLYEYLDGFLASARRQDHGARVFYGKALVLSYHEDSVGECADLGPLLSEHAVSRFAIGPDDKLPGGVDRRLLHSVASASKAYDIPVDTVRAVVMESGLVAEADYQLSDKAMVFSMADAHDKLFAASGAIGFKEAALQLGVTIGDMFDITTVFPLHIGTPLQGHHHGRTISKEKLDALESKIRAAVAADPDCDSTGMHSVADFIAKQDVPVTVVLQTLITGTVARTAVLANVTGLGGILVDPETLLAKIRTPVKLNLRKLSVMMHVRESVIEELVADGHVATAAAFNPVSRRYESYVTDEELVRFRRMFIPFSEIMSLVGPQGRCLWELVKRMDLTPVAGSGQTAVYRRRDVETAIFRIVG